MNDDEAQFSVEFPVDTQAFMWSDKYRPRKPRFFNRVHTVSTFLPFLNHIALRKAKIVYPLSYCTQKGQNCIPFTLLHSERQKLYTLYPIALRKAKIVYPLPYCTQKGKNCVYNFCLSECNRVN